MWSQNIEGQENLQSMAVAMKHKTTQKGVKITLVSLVTDGFLRMAHTTRAWRTYVCESRGISLSVTDAILYLEQRRYAQAHVHYFRLHLRSVYVHMKQHALLYKPWYSREISIFTQLNANPSTVPKGGDFSHLAFRMESHWCLRIPAFNTLTEQYFPENFNCD